MAHLKIALCISRLVQYWVLIGSAFCYGADAELASEAAHANDPALIAPVRMVVPEVAPWGYFDAQELPAGLLIDFQRALFKRAKVSVTTKLRPYPRVVHDLASGSSDLGVMFVSPLAEQSGMSLGHVVTMRVILISSDTRAKAINGLEDLNDERVGFVRGAKYGRRFDEYPGFEHIAVTSVEQGLRMLVTDRLDAMVATEQALLYAMYTTGIPASEFITHLTLGNARADLYLSRHSDNLPWIGAVRAALSSMNRDGTGTAIFYQHDLWPRHTYCFSGGRCLQAVEPPEDSK